MSVTKVHGAYPTCSHPRCNNHGDDGYCTATCCVVDNDDPGLAPKAYCTEHSHRPTKVLEILGHAHDQQSFTRAEVERILRAMWVGAGMVFEAEGYFAMNRDVSARVQAAVGRTKAPDAEGV